MKELELTENEIAKLSALDTRQINQRQQMQEMQRKLQELEQKKQAILQQIKERADVPEDFPVSDFDFSQVDFDSFKGSVMIPEEEDSEE